MAAAYRDRTHAGDVLAGLLVDHDPGTVVLGIPRGGVPVAAAIAAELGTALDVAVARKIGAPSNPEFAVGAVAADGVGVWDERALARHGIAVDEVSERARLQAAEVERRLSMYRAGRSAVPVTDRDVVVVDDGVATGWTMVAVVGWVQRLGAASVTVAVPVGSAEAVEWLEDIADEVVCPLIPRRFMAVGQWYDDFHQLGDDEVVAALERHA
ncbi:MAG: phosphoribosyltransferase [Acidimicrobiia bacterium]|nr:phosphoribosyltransferase [Acidimicrobiia bacterium]